MQDKDLMSMFEKSEPYLDDNGFTDKLMSALPVDQPVKVINPWIARLPFIAMFMAMIVVAVITPIGEMFTQLVLNPMQWESWWMLAIMVAVLIGVALVWAYEERSLDVST